MTFSSVFCNLSVCFTIYYISSLLWVLGDTLLFVAEKSFKEGNLFEKGYLL